MKKTNKKQYPVYLLSGGKSSRFGEDKARALLKQKPLLLHMADSLSNFTADLFVIADKENKYADLGLCTLADLQPDLGPIGGLITAAKHHAERKINGWFLIAPCDLLGIQEQWIQLLSDECQKPRNAIAFKGTHWQPLPAFYHSSIVSELEAYITEKQSSVWKFLERTNAHPVQLPKNWEESVQVNTKNDLAKYKNLFFAK